MRIEIFCRVIDNYGDAGFAWRMCRIFQLEHGADVVLWIDDLHRLAALAPLIDPQVTTQVVGNVCVRLWPVVDTGTETAVSTSSSCLVLELFGCGLPPAALMRFEAQRIPPVWLHIDYLTAEAWADDFNALPSPVGLHRLTRFFLVPGFSRLSAGLLRERQPLAVLCGHDEQAAWQRLKLPADGLQAQLRISLFCYPQAPLPALLDCLKKQAGTGVLLVAGQAVKIPDFSPRWQIVHLPWLSQADYDTLLLLCHVNFVRGEESCVRAQLTGRPFIWQAYLQDRADRQNKVAALLRRLSECSAPDAGLNKALTQTFTVWNDLGSDASPVNPDASPSALSFEPALTQLLSVLPAWSAWMERWTAHLLTLPRLTTAILNLHDQVRAAAGISRQG